MNLGLGNLIELKRQLLNAGQLAETTYDTVITGIGRGVAGWFDGFCNRKFERAVGAIDQFSADRQFWIVNRFPLEAVTAINQRDDLNSGWVSKTINDVLANTDDEKGLLKFWTTLGSHLWQVRVTYTGGYWFDTSEDGSGVQPAGSTLLPHDVKQAWYEQCRETWLKIDRLGLSLIQGEGDKNFVAQMLAGMEMVPAVKAKLSTYVRHQLT